MFETPVTGIPQPIPAISLAGPDLAEVPFALAGREQRSTGGVAFADCLTISAAGGSGRFELTHHRTFTKTPALARGPKLRPGAPQSVGRYSRPGRGSSRRDPAGSAQEHPRHVSISLHLHR